MSDTNSNNKPSVDDTFKLLWPPPMLQDTERGATAIRVNLLDYTTKPKSIANKHNPSAGVKDDQHNDKEEMLPYFEQEGAGIKVLPDKIILDKTVYKNHDRETTQKLLAQHFQSSCQEQGYPISVKEWANPNQQRDTLRMRLRCKNQKCAFQFQLNWERKSEHWYISRRGRCGKFEHTCGPPSTTTTSNKQAVAPVSTNNKRKGPPSGTSDRQSSKEGPNKKKARTIQNCNSKVVVSHGFDVVVPPKQNVAEKKNSHRAHHEHRLSDLSSTGSLVNGTAAERGDLATEKVAATKHKVRVEPVPNDGEAIASLMALSAGKTSSAASSLQNGGGGLPPPAVQWSDAKNDGSSSSSSSSFRICPSSQAFREIVESMPLDIRSKLMSSAGADAGGILYRARMDSAGLVFEPCSDDNDKEDSLSTTSSSVPLRGDDDTTRDTREPACTTMTTVSAVPPSKATGVALTTMIPQQQTQRWTMAKATHHHSLNAEDEEVTVTIPPNCLKIEATTASQRPEAEGPSVAI